MTDTKFFATGQPGGDVAIIDRGVHPNRVFWVGSTVTGASDSAGFGQNPGAPVATLDYAIGLCTASKGDVIYLLPYHAETLSTATSCVIDIIGVKIIGLGTGAARPTFTYTTAAGALISITVADVSIENIICISAFTNGITSGITIAATGDGATLKNVEMRESLNTQEFLIAITIAAAAADVTIDGLRFFGVAGGTDSQCIIAAGAAHNLVIKNCFIHGDFSGAAVDALTALSSNVLIENNTVINVDAAAGLGISVKSDTTGYMRFNHVTNLKNTVVGCVGAAMAFCENYCSNALGASGIILPAVDS